jgi:hypothetical protein
MNEHTASAPTDTSAAGLRQFVAEKQTQAGETNMRRPRFRCKFATSAFAALNVVSGRASAPSAASVFKSTFI